jgi:hypothetical protein
MPWVLLIVALFATFSIVGACNDDSPHCRYEYVAGQSVSICTDSNGVTTTRNQ